MAGDAFPNSRGCVLGSALTPALKRAALACYANRFTGDHKPGWAQDPRPDGTAYPVQFKDDADWLANTWFSVTEAGVLRAGAACYSTPTWPHSPELRKVL